MYCIDQQPVLSSWWVKGSVVKIVSFLPCYVRLSISRINSAPIFFIVDKVHRLFGGVAPGWFSLSVAFKVHHGDFPRNHFLGLKESTSDQNCWNFVNSETKLFCWGVLNLLPPSDMAAVDKCEGDNHRIRILMLLSPDSYPDHCMTQ